MGKPKQKDRAARNGQSLPVPTACGADIPVCRKYVADRNVCPTKLNPYAPVAVHCALLCVFLAGCTGMPHNAATPDPLLGGPGLKPGLQNQTGQPALPTTALPPPAAPNSAMSNAALAAGVPRPFDNSRDLRIGTPRANPSNDGWGQQGPGAVANGSGATLHAPEAAVEPAARQEPASISSTVSQGTTKPNTFDQAQAQLKARGVIWQDLKLVADTGEWKFSCSLPNKQNPRLRRIYEARARDNLAAIQAVLEQIDRDQ